MESAYTKEECEDMIQKRNHVCEWCGRKLIAVYTVNNSGVPVYWSSCYHKDEFSENGWGIYTGGVPKEIYDWAVKIVIDNGIYVSISNHFDDTEKGITNWFYNECHIIARKLFEYEYLRKKEIDMSKEDYILSVLNNKNKNFYNSYKK